MKQPCIECKVSQGKFTCSWIVGRNPERRCGALLCEGCAYSPAAKKYLCKTHRTKYECWVVDRTRKPETAKEK